MLSFTDKLCSVPSYVQYVLVGDAHQLTFTLLRVAMIDVSQNVNFVINTSYDLTELFIILSFSKLCVS